MARAATGALLVLLCLTGCSDDADDDAADTVVVSQEVPPGAVVQSDRVAEAGHFRVRVLYGVCGIETVTGTHAEFSPEEPLCRLRVRVTSQARDLQTFATDESLLLLEGDAEREPSVDAMGIKRVPKVVPLGPGNAVEVDLWFKKPDGVGARALRFVGKPDPGAVEPVVPVVEVPLSGL